MFRDKIKVIQTTLLGRIFEAQLQSYVTLIKSDKQKSVFLCG